ncbi:F-box domain-containing protein [Artemisia annua]|uniref:F-box domain-containing protein n=1 Tax=Artemisia annua TaxID=35608 RepID=A0A2U1L7L4_ARTAN|nr:F-box domain-containing protein [Artemisia annua]
MSSQNNLPPEIIESILRRLPAKSLGRFKSISKPWCSLISNPQFIKAHFHHNKSTSKVLLVSDSNSLYALDINEPYLKSNKEDVDISITAKELAFPLVQPPIMWEEVLGSCNGLVLAKDVDDKVFITNPTTREVMEVPFSPFALPVHESFVMYGFGYDSSSEDYRVITISFWDTDNEHNPDCTDMYVCSYSLRENSWRKLSDSPYDHAVGHLTSGVLVNENLHWLTSVRPGYSSTIAAFSLVNEEFSEIDLPSSINNDNAVFNELVVVGGKLGVFGTRLGNDLWVMEEYGVGASWIKVSIHGVEIDPVKPICSIEGSDRDIVLGDEDGIVVYNIDDRRCRNVRIEGGPNGFAIGGTYVESLESATCIIRRP